MMPRSISARQIETMRTAGRYSVGGGLYIRVSETGTKNWVFRYQRHGKRQDAGLGAYPAVSLAGARKAAIQAQQQLAQGLDPIQERRAALRPVLTVPTFEQVAKRVQSDTGNRLSNDKSVYRISLLLGPKYCSSLQNRPVNSITCCDLAPILNAVAADKPETARKLHGALGKVFELARVILQDQHHISLGREPTNLRDLKAYGYKAQVVNQPHPALDWREAPNFMQGLRARDGVAYRALELTMLTGLRVAAVTGAEWPEFDLDAAIWTVPLNRLKDRNHRRHPLRIPLSTQALNLILGLRRLDQRWVFPGQRPKRPLVAQSPLQVLKLKLNKDANGNPIWLDPDTRRPIVVHGFRATLKTFADDHGIRYEVSEYSLGHAVGGNVERRYRRTDLLEDRRRFLQLWADHCTGAASAQLIRIRA